MSNKILVIYNSKTGFTERYAQWLAEELPCDLFPYAERSSADFGSYDAVVFGGWFHAGTIVGFKWFKERLSQFTGMTAAVFATGATPAGTPEMEEMMAKKPTGEIPLFYCQSGLSYEQMGPVDKLMMAAFRKMMKKIQGEDSEMYKAIQHSYDASSKDKLAPLVEYLRELP